MPPAWILALLLLTGCPSGSQEHDSEGARRPAASVTDTATRFEEAQRDSADEVANAQLEEILRYLHESPQARLEQ